MERATLSEVVLRLREGLGWEQHELADALGCELATVEALEGGSLRRPPYQVLREIEGLGIGAVDLLLATGVITPNQYDRLAALELELPEPDWEECDDQRIYAGLRLLMEAAIQQLAANGRKGTRGKGRQPVGASSHN